VISLIKGSVYFHMSKTIFNDKRAYTLIPNFGNLF